MSTNNTTSIAFLGASTGCGLAALKRAVSSPEKPTCVALCRNTGRLTDVLSPDTHPNLVVKQGNAHSIPDLSSILVRPSDPARFVDVVLFSIGGKLDTKTMKAEDPLVCQKGMAALLQALKDLRAKGATGSPCLSVVSTTGIAAQRDVPILFLPMYRWLLHTPHEDKRVMERDLGNSDEEWTVVRPSLLTNGAETEGLVRVGVEDLKTGARESTAIGYTISREDVGKWLWENVLRDRRYMKKAVSITY